MARLSFSNAFHEIYEYRFLAWKLAVADFNQRYKNSSMGLVWSLLEPLLMLSVLYVVFTNLMKLDVPYYPVFLLSGIISWNFFDRATSMAANAVSGKPSLVQKVYFPREILVFSSCLTAALMSAAEIIVLFGIAAFVVSSPVNASLFWLLPVLFAEFLLAFGAGLFLASLNTAFRDVQYIWRVVLQAGFFASPVLYPLSVLPPSLTSILSYSPMAAIITALRAPTVYGVAPDLSGIAYAYGVALAVTALGMMVFRHYEPYFAELV